MHFHHEFECVLRRDPAQQLSSPYWYRVTFPQAPDLMFTIGLAQTDPRTLPTIQCNNVPLLISPADSWPHSRGARERLRHRSALFETGMPIDAYVSNGLAARKEQKFHQALAQDVRTELLTNHRYVQDHVT
jgi:hypothetical protein